MGRKMELRSLAQRIDAVGFSLEERRVIVLRLHERKSLREIASRDGGERRRGQAAVATSTTAGASGGAGRAVDQASDGACLPGGTQFLQAELIACTGVHGRIIWTVLVWRRVRRRRG